ncbi:MAG: polyphosphate kinase 2 family protein [Spirosomaceae bacterium]|nr:polyphosphate kinase 2 family protein [Spirosomataceae bacterium]MDP5139786.1 polyphosphate kinase 2 family protein [Spirosomataceae bacterium]
MGKSKINSFKVDGSKSIDIRSFATDIEQTYQDKSDYKDQLKSLTQKLDAIQEKMYAHNRYGVLVIFQALDAAGKDSTVRAVFKRINPHGTVFHSFKRPTSNELEHDYMWRCFTKLPERGKIGVFNRSYYEEVLVTKVHPEIITDYQLLPLELTKDLDLLFKNRYSDIKNFETYLNNNGIEVVKFFLNVSKKEQGKRLIDRIKEENKNWKFEEGDIKERALFDNYLDAFELAINNTSTEASPWYIIPSDDKYNMRLLVAEVLHERLKALPVHFPESDENRQAELSKFINIIKEQNLD